MNTEVRPVEPRVPAALRRWPTVAGLVFGGALAAAVAFGRLHDVEVAQVLTAAAFIYLGAAALGRRWAAWPLFGVTIVVIGFGALVPGPDALWLLAGLGAVALGWGLVAGRSRPGWGVPLQAIAMAAVLLLSLAVTAIGQPWAGLLAGAGLLAHAGWDVWHFVRGRVVQRSLAEFCMVLDTVLGLVVIVLSLAG